MVSSRGNEACSTISEWYRVQVRGLFESCKNALAIVLDNAGLAVHEPLCADNLPTKGFADGLVAKTDPQYGRFAGHVADKRHQDARFARGAGAG